MKAISFGEKFNATLAGKHLIPADKSITEIDNHPVQGDKVTITVSDAVLRHVQEKSRIPSPATVNLGDGTTVPACINFEDAFVVRTSMDKQIAELSWKERQQLSIRPENRRP